MGVGPALICDLFKLEDYLIQSCDKNIELFTRIVFESWVYLIQSCDKNISTSFIWIVLVIDKYWIKIMHTIVEYIQLKMYGGYPIKRYVKYLIVIKYHLHIFLLFCVDVKNKFLSNEWMVGAS